MNAAELSDVIFLVSSCACRNKYLETYVVNFSAF